MDGNEKDYLIEEVYPILMGVMNESIKKGHTPMEVFGLLLGFIANEFRRYGYSQEEWVEFLVMMSECKWPETKPTRPTLTLVK